MEGKGLVQLGNTERQLPTVRGIVGGEAPQDADLLGPSHIPTLSPEIHGKGPHWVRMEDGVSYVFSSTEVEGPRRLGVPVAQVHNVAREIWDGPTLDGELERKLSGTKGQDPEAVTRDLVSQLRTRLRSRSS